MNLKFAFMKRAILTLILCMIGAVAFAQSYVIVAGDNVCLRYEPHESAKMTGQYAPHFYTGDTLPYCGQTGEYYKVRWNDSIYYLPMKYGRLRGGNGQSSSSQSYGSVVIAGDDVCLRAQPDESTKMTSYGSPRLYTGEVYPYYGTVGNYYRIGVNGRTYYIPKKYGRLR